MTDRRDPSAAGNLAASAFEPFHLEREIKADGRSILFYSWPDEPPVPEGVGLEGPGHGATPPAQPWSPEAQPAEVDEPAEGRGPSGTDV